MQQSGMRIGVIFATFSLIAAAFQGTQPNGPQLIREGKLDAALYAFQSEVKEFPKSVTANNGAGVVLDLIGRPTEAWPYFTAAIKAAKTPLERATAQRAMAISHAFAGDCKGAEKYENSAFEFFLGTGDFFNAGEVANELGRICLEAGDFSRASEWYSNGFKTGSDQPDISQSRSDLWKFRYAHAKARMAARQGKMDDARKQVAAAKAILDKGTNPEQKEYFPYLSGYVAFYAGDYPAALAALQEASQTDPFIQCLIGRTYEAMGNHERAGEYYRRAAATTAHSVPAAFARPFARKQLE